MPQIFLTSDIHIDHPHVANIRGFSTPAEHDAHLVQVWNKRVNPNDTVYILGDVHIGAFDRAIPTLSQLNGNLRLIYGNHDRLNPTLYNVNGALFRQGVSIFETMSNEAVLKYRGVKFLLSHYPYEGEGERDNIGEDRFTQFRLADEGMPLLHGHTHSKNTNSYSTKHTPMIHVGWDARGKPITVHEIYEEYVELSRNL